MQGVTCCFDGMAHFPVKVTAFNADFCQVTNTFHGAGFVKVCHGGGNDALKFLVADFTFFTAADQQHTFGQGVGYMVQEQSLSDFSFNVTAS